MRRRLCWLATLAGVLSLGVARAQPPVWTTAGARGAVVLFGSIHLLPAGLDWRSPALTAALGHADELWFEIPIGGEADARAARLLRRRGLLPPGERLSAELPAAVWARLGRDAAAAGLNPAELDRARPWLADATLSVATATKAGAAADSGVERRIDAVTAPRVRRRALETLGEQIGFLAAGSAASQVAALEATLGEVEGGQGDYARLVGDWLNGDLDGLQADALDPLRTAAPEAFQRLIVERNRRWARIIVRRLQRRGNAVFVVGVGHLVGPAGVPALLRARGLAVAGP